MGGSVGSPVFTLEEPWAGIDHEDESYSYYQAREKTPVISLVAHVWQALVAYTGNVYGSAMQVFFISVFVFLVTVLLAAWNWKWLVLAVPAGAWFTLQVLAIYPSMMWVAFSLVVLVVIIELLLLLGPVRVSAYAQQAGPSRTVLVICVALALLAGCGIALYSYLHGYVIVLSRYAGGGVYRLPRGQWTAAAYFCQTYAAAGMSLLLYFGLTSIYLALTSCFALESRPMEGVLTDCQHTMTRRPIRSLDQISFSDDPNVYHVTPGLFRRLHPTVGGRYSYTVATSFGGRQFIRHKPELLTPAPDTYEYEHPYVSGFKRNKPLIILWVVLGVALLVGFFIPLLVGLGPIDYNKGIPKDAQAAITNNLVALAIQTPEDISSHQEALFGSRWGLIVGPDTVVVPYDLITGAAQVSVKNSAKATSKATMLGFDSADDIAVLHVPGITQASPVAWSTTQLKPGMKVWATGLDPGSEPNEPACMSYYVSTVTNTAAVSPNQLNEYSAHPLGKPSGLIAAEVADPLFKGQSMTGLESSVMLDSANHVAGMVITSTSTDKAATVYFVPAAGIQSVVSAVEAGRTTPTIHIGPAGSPGAAF